MCADGSGSVRDISQHSEIVIDKNPAIDRFIDKLLTKDILTIPQETHYLKQTLFADDFNVFTINSTTFSHMLDTFGERFYIDKRKRSHFWEALSELSWIETLTLDAAFEPLSSSDTDVHSLALTGSACIFNHLIELDLSNNGLTKIHESIGTLPELTRLKITGNNITDLPATIAQNEKIEVIYC